MWDPHWCLTQSRRIGAACHALIAQLFADRVLDNLRAAQGIVRLAERYGTERVQAACRLALAFNNPRYRTVKTILNRTGSAQGDPRRGRIALAFGTDPSLQNPLWRSDRLPGYIAASTSCSLASANVSLAQYARKSSKV